MRAKRNTRPEENPMEIEAEIRDFIARNLLYSESGLPHGDDASFLDEGTIDSIGVLELVNFVGEHFGLTVSPTEITPENFDSVTRLARFVRNRKTPGAPAGP
jgi:acyl carrier protein